TAVFNGTDVTSSATWSTSNAAVASVAVGNAGVGIRAVVAAKGSGAVTIRAATPIASASVLITVGDSYPFFLDMGTPSPLVVGVTPAEIVIDVGGGGSLHPGFNVSWGDGQTSSFPAGTSFNSGCALIDRCVRLDHVYQAAGTYTSTLTASISSPVPVL